MLRSRRRVLRILTLIQRNWSTLIQAKDMGLRVDIFCWLSETFSRRQVFNIEKLLSWIVVKIFGRFRYIFFCLDFSVVWMSECLLRLLLPVFSNNFIVFFFLSFYPDLQNFSVVLQNLFKCANLVSMTSFSTENDRIFLENLFLRRLRMT